MKRLLPFALRCLLFLAGGAPRQLEEELLVIVLTVDRLETGDVTVSVKAPRNASGEGDNDRYLTVEATGCSFSDAVTMLNAATPRPVNFSQVREVIIGESAAKQEDFARLFQGAKAVSWHPPESLHRNNAQQLRGQGLHPEHHPLRRGTGSGLRLLRPAVHFRRGERFFRACPRQSRKDAGQ